MIHNVHLRRPYKEQRKFIDSPAKRKVIRAGRRSGKTVGVAILAAKAFLNQRRVLYATPTQDQVQRFWFEVTQAFREPIAADALYKNETEHVILLPGTETRIRAKTAWNADTLRGDYADLLILDEWQLMNEDAWEIVGAPMLLDNNGDAVFVYTPPSYRTAGISKARDKRHAARLFEMAQADTTGRWATFHFSSHDNPKLSKQALAEIAKDMTQTAYEQEILALDVSDDLDAHFRREWWDGVNRYSATDSPLLAKLVGRWISVDTALKDAEGSDYTALGVYELLPDYRLVMRYAEQGKWQFPDLLNKLEQTATRFNRDEKLRGVLIEDKGSGTSALQSLRMAAPDWLSRLLCSFMPQGSKEYRASQASLWCERGMILLPEPSEQAAWLMDFESELFNFPSAAHDDLVDQFTQAILYLENLLAEGYQSRIRILTGGR